MKLDNLNNITNNESKTHYDYAKSNGYSDTEEDLNASLAKNIEPSDDIDSAIEQGKSEMYPYGGRAPVYGYGRIGQMAIISSKKR